MCWMAGLRRMSPGQWELEVTVWGGHGALPPGGLRVRGAETEARPGEAEGTARQNLAATTLRGPLWGSLLLLIAPERAEPCPHENQWSGAMCWDPVILILEDLGEIGEDHELRTKTELLGPARPAVLRPSNTGAAEVRLTPSRAQPRGSASLRVEAWCQHLKPQLIPRCSPGLRDHRLCLLSLLG